jgi:hypothetical protein
MADQWEYGPQDWGFNFMGEPYQDPMTDFPFLDFDELAAGDMWTENQSPTLHGAASSGMDIFGSDLWMENQSLLLHDPSFRETNISNGLDMTLSYKMGPKSESHTNSSSGLATPSTAPENSISPIQRNALPVPPLPRRPKKRRLEDYQSEFMGPEPVQNERRRRPYQEERRMEVGMVRQVGACIRCKIMKTPVSQPPHSREGIDSYQRSAGLEHHA